MTKNILAVLAAAVALYMWGFAFWGATMLPYRSFARAADDQAAQQALRQHFPSKGVYVVPGMHLPAEEFERLHQAGPVAMVTVMDADGGPVMDPAIMGMGFVHGAVVCVLLAWLLSWVGAGMAFGEKVRLAVFAGVLIAVAAHLGDAVWWVHPWGWELVRSLYMVVGFAIAGAILAKMLPRPA